MRIKVFGREYFFPLGDLLNYTRPVEYYWISKFAAIGEGDWVCDVACGDGFWTNRIAGKAAGVIGVDYNGERIRWAAKKYGGDHAAFIVADAMKLPLRSGSFNKVISVCALEHFQDDREALREMRRVIQPGGILSMSVDSMSLSWIPKRFLEDHRKRYFVCNYYSIDDLRAKLEDCGFHVLDYRFLTRSRPASWIARYAVRYRRTFQLFFPILFPITLLADSFRKNGQGGHKIVIKARTL